MKSAIVTTFVDGEEVIDSFIKYHKIIGYDYFIFFIDNNSQQMIDYLKSKYSENIIVFGKDKHYYDLLESLDLYYKFKPYIDREVMARQILNANIAIKLCLENNINWLTHIDIDELFYLKSHSTVNDFFKYALDNNFYNIVHYNYEAQPIHLEISNYFKEVNLFKVNLYELLYKSKYDPNIKKIIKTLSYIEFNIENFFCSYINGKSSVYIEKDTYCESVHVFNKKIHDINSINNISIDIENKILHYSNCSYNRYKNKYKNLGNFSDKWFDYFDIKNIAPFHIDSRNTFLKNDEQKLKQFYIDNVIRYDNQNINYFIKIGILKVITNPQDILKL